MINVEIIFVDEVNTVFQKQIHIENGATVLKALTASDILSLYPEALSYSVGIFSKPVSMETALRAGDRIEIYRPLQCDPKTRRRMRAKQ